MTDKAPESKDSGVFAMNEVDEFLHFERIFTFRVDKKRYCAMVLQVHIKITVLEHQPILDACKRLHDYSYFIEEVNKQLSGRSSTDVAINKAIDSCIEKGVLVDILEKCRSEVFHMILTEYDEKKHLRNVRREGREEGQEQINSLYERLMESNRMDDVVRAIKDKKFREKLLKEFNL